MTQSRRDSRLIVGYSVEGASETIAQTRAVAESYSSAADAAAKFSPAVLALNPALAALVAQEQAAAAAAQGLSQAQVSAAAATQTLADTTILSAQKSVGAQVGVTAAFNDTDVAVKNVIRDIGDLGKDIESLPDPAIGAFAGEGAGGSIGGKISGASRALFNLPDVQLAPGISTTVLSRVGLLAGNATDALGLTAVQLGAVGLGAGALVLVMKAVTDQFAAARDKANAFLVAQGQIEGVVTGGATRDVLQASRDKAVADQEALQNTVDTGRQLLQNFNDATQDISNALNTVGTIVSDEDLAALAKRAKDAETALSDFFGVSPRDIGAIAGITSSLDDMQKKADESGVSVAAANLKLHANATAAADAAAAEQQLTEARRKAAAEADAEIAKSQVGLAQDAASAQTLTAPERAREVEAISLQITALEAAIETYHISGAAADQLNAQITDLQNKQVALTDVTLSYADVQQQLADQTAQQLASAERALDVDRLTADQRAERSAQDARDVNVLTRLIGAGDLSQATVTELATRIRGLNEDAAALTNTTDTYADAQQRLSDQLKAINDDVAKQTNLFEQIRTASVESVADRLHGIQEEQSAIRASLPELERLAPTSVEAANALKDARSRLGELSSDYVDFITRVLPAAQARAEQKLAEDRADIEQKSQANLDKIAADRTEAEGKAATARSDAYVAVEDKRNEALTKLAEDQAAARAKIERNATADIESAIFARDALAAFKAEEKKKQDLADLDEQGRERAGEIDKQAQKDRDQADKNYRKSLQQAQEAADKAIRLEKTRAATELNERINAYNRQMSLLDTFNQQSAALFTQFTNNGLSAIRRVTDAIGDMDRLLSGASGGSTGTGGVGDVIVGGGGNTNPWLMPSNPNIGDVWTDPTGHSWLWTGRAWQPATVVRQGSSAVSAASAFNATNLGLPPASVPTDSLAIRTPPPARGTLQQPIQTPISTFGATGRAGAGGGGLTINIPITGTQMTRQDIKRTVHTELDDTLTAAGWD